MVKCPLRSGLPDIKHLGSLRPKNYTLLCALWNSQEPEGIGDGPKQIISQASVQLVCILNKPEIAGDISAD